ncbi:MAG: FlgD immunoglobulin-like domain containing protein [candidate division WOR-3 bacterium]
MSNKMILINVISITLLFGQMNIYVPGRDNALIYEPYDWVFHSTLDDYCWKAVGLVEGQHYNVNVKRQLQNPGTSPTGTVTWIKNALQSHLYGVVWWAAHANGGPGNEPDRISAEPYELTSAGWAAAQQAYQNYLNQGYYGLVQLGQNEHAYSIAITAQGFQTWTKTPSTIDSALVYFWGCRTVYLYDDVGAAFFLGYDEVINLGSTWGADTFWNRMNGYEDLMKRRSYLASLGLAGGHLIAGPTQPWVSQMVLAPTVAAVYFNQNYTNGYLPFDSKMSHYYPNSEILTVTGATITDMWWGYFDTELHFIIGNVTQCPQYYTVHYDKAVGMNLDNCIELDGNQNPPNTNGHGPNCDDYKFLGYAQTGISEHETPGGLVLTTHLQSLNPNPGFSKIYLDYQIANSGETVVNIFNCGGRLVKHIRINDCHGKHTFIWDGTDDNGNKLPSGCYFVRFEAGDYKEIKKFVLIR